MKICRVIGTVVATVRQHDFDSLKLMLCQPLDVNGRHSGATIIAADRVQAGVGDKVIVMSEGNGCRQLWGVAVDDPLAIRSAIVGIVDDINITQLEAS